MIAFLSNTNIEPIKGFFKEETYFAGFNQYAFELIEEKSMLHSKKITTVILFIDGEEFLKDIIGEQMPTAQLLEKANGRMVELLEMIKQYITKKGNVCFFINNIVLPVHSITPNLKNREIDLFDIEIAMNKKLEEFVKRIHDLLILDWRMIVKNMGYNNLHDDKFWYLGRIKLNNKAFSAIAENYQNLLNAYQGKTKKVLVLDLDNTLWGGIIGEDGPNGIQLSEDGQGKIYREFQAVIKTLKQIGVLLCINSKNNESDVEPVLSRHPMMILKSDDFVVKKINWNDKVKNMEEIARELNLGLDSFVFIDDNAVERENVEKNLPSVTIPEFPKDVSTLKRWFFESVVYKYFGKIYLGDEDLNKTDQYKIKLKRDSLSTGLSMNKFIKGLEIKLKVYINPTEYIQRIAQLTQKTNQFNFTSKRYSEAQIKKFIEDDSMQVFGLDYEDKFGREGLIGVAILKINRSKGEAKLDTFLLSCRTIGKNVEYAFMVKILEKAQEYNLLKIKIEFEGTGKNEVARTFYGQLKGKDEWKDIKALLIKSLKKTKINQIDIL